MPIFEIDGKKYNVQEKHIEQFATEHPEATSIFEKDGKRYRVKAMDYGHFSGQKSTPYEYNNSVAPEPSRAEELMPKIEEASKEEKPKVRTQMTYSSPHFNPISYTSSTEKVKEQPQTLTPEQQEAMKAQRQQLSDMTSSVQQSLDRRGAELDEIARQTPGAFVARGTAGSIAGFDAGRMYDAEYRDYAAAKESLDKAQDMINAADKEAEDREQGRTGFGGFWRGAGRGAKDAALDWNTWSMGLKDTSEGHALLKALDAAEDGTLTPSQQTLLDAKAIELATAHAYESQLGRGYKAGKGVTESLPFMMEFAFNPIAGAGKTAANRMARYALNRFGKEAVKKNAGKYLATQAAANVGGDILKAGAMAATTGAGRTTADALRRMQGDIYYQPNEEGKVEYWKRENAKGAGEAFKKAYLNTTLENFSEFLGNYFAPIGKASSEGLVKGLNKIGLNKVNDFIENVKASDIAKLVSDFENKAQWNGTIGEFAEEVSNGILNSIFVGDQTRDTDENTGVFNRDNLIDTFIQTSLIGGGVSAAKTIGYPIAKYNAKRNYEREKANFEEHFGTTDQPTFYWDGKKIPMGEALASSDARIVGGALRDIVGNEDYPIKHQMTALKYAGAAKKYKGAEVMTEKRKADPEIPIEQVNVEESYENGRNISTPEEKNEAKTNLDVAAEEMRRVFGLNTDEDIDEYIGNDIYGFVQQKRDENPDDGQVVLNYINAKAEMDGLYDRINDDIDRQVEQSNRIIDSRKSNDDGMIHPATLSVNDRKVYIISGNVARRDDGTIDTTNSTKDGIIVMDAETGKTEFVDAKDFREVADAIDAEQEKANAAELIANTISEREEKEIDGTLAFASNDTYTILDNEGAEHNIVVVGDNGDGTINAIVDSNEKPQVMAKADVQAMSDNAKKARKTAEIEAKRVSNKVVESSRNEAVAEPTANVEQAPERVVPKLKNGQPDFNAMDADMFVQEYASRYGEESTAKLARKNISSAREEIAKIDKKIDDITDPNQMQGLFDKKAEAEARLNRYVDILDRMGMSEDANETEADQKSKLRNEAGNKIVSLFPDGLPNVESFILADIATGNRIRWSDKETNGAVTSRGLGSELGLSGSNKERVKRLALISNDAMTPEEYAESLRERLDAAGIRYDETALRDDVINTYASVDTRKSAWEALENIANRANEQYQELMDWEDAQQRIAYEKAKNAVELPAAPDLATIEEEVPVELGASFDENINEIENIFNDERSTENTDVPTSVSAEDGIADGDQTSIEVVQGAGVDSTLGDRGSIEAGQGSNEGDERVRPETISSTDVYRGAEVDNQGNPINLDGSLKLEKVESIDDMTDEDFENPYRNIELPTLPENVADAIGSKGKSVVIKKNIFERNIIRHSDLTPDQSRDILKSALYSPNLYGQNQKKHKPYNWVVVSTKDANGQNKLVLLEISDRKNNIEIVHWHYVDARGLEKLKRQAEREDGQLLILPSESTEEVGALSDPTLSMPSENKDTTSEPQKQDVEQKNDDHRIVFDAFGKDYISQDGKNSFRITQIDGAKRVANVNVNTEAVGADNLEMTFEEVANLFRNGQWTEATSTPQQVEGVDIVTIKKDKHTKTGEDLFVAKIKDRVSRDEYNRIKGVAKEHDGYYSTAKRGFIFKTESDAEAFRVATQVPSAQMEDAKKVSLTELREVGSATNDIVEPIPTSDTEPQWKYELTVYDNGSTILERSRVMPNGVPVYDANFDMRAANPREMLDILNNPSNNMQAVLEQVGSRLEQRATVWDFREKVRTEGVNGYKIGDTVKYTYNGKQEVGTIYDFEDYGDHNPILDLGTAPVLYVSAQWDQVEKVNEQPTIEQLATVTPSGNKLVTDERYEELKRKMRQKLGGQMNMGIDPEILAIGTEMAVYHIEKGARKFADLQSEYDALDKNDAKALNEWREKKTGILQSYMNDVTEEFNLPVKESYVYDPTNEDDIKRIYDAYVAALDRRGITSPIEPYEEFDAELQELDAAYREDADIIVANRNSMENSEQDVFEAIMHEQTHGVVSRIISTRALRDVWEEGKAKKPEFASVIENEYKGEGEARWGDEFLTYYLVRTLFSPRVRAKAEAYIKGESKITAEKFVKHTQDLLPLTNDALKQILNFYKDEYQKKTIHGFRSESSRGSEEIRGGIQRRVVSNARTERERRGADRGFRGRVLESANALAASLGVKLNVVDAIPNAPKGVKGRYSISTDQVYFVLPNATSVEDAKRTVLHEVVAHKGLRDVVGRERFNKFLDKVFQATTLDVRSKIIELAKNNSWNVRVATEEYLASLAEKGFDGRENRTFWEKVRDLFMDMLREAKIILGFNINDNDMLYMLWRTYQMQRSNGIMAVAEDVVMQRKLGVGRFRPQDTNSLFRVTPNEREQIIADAKADGTYLKAPNGKDTNLTPEQWVTVRTDAFKKWFGDWENDSANASKVVDANGEPKVVEHSTWNDDFYTFDIEHLGESSGDEGVYGAGFYFGNAGNTEIYGDRAIQAYLNMRNPIVLPDAPIMGFFDYLVKNFDKDGLRDIEVKQGNNTATMGDVVDAIKAVNNAHARGEYADLIEQMSQYWSPADEMVLEQQIFRKIGFAIYGALEPFIEYNVGRKKLSEALRNAGYDGVVYDSTEYVAFNPNQIKSATDNVGTFDSSNDDIRYRVAPSIPSTGEARQLYDDAVRRYTKKNNVKKTENLWHHLREAYQDSMLSVKKLMDAVLAETGNKLRGADDVYRAENQLSSKNNAEIEKWERDFMKPLQLEILDLVKKGASYEDIVEYLLAKHGLERNLEFSRREAEEDGKAWDGFVKRDFSGLTELTGEAEHFTEAAQQIVEEFEGKYNTTNLWSKINAATKEALRKSYESSLMNKETYDKVSKMFKYYIPLRGWDSNVASDEYEYMANKGMKILPALKTAKGRTSRADDPIATLGSMGESSIIQGNRNQMKLKFLNFALSNPTSLLTVSEQWYEQNADGTWRPSNPEIPEEASADEVDTLIKEHEAKMEALGDKATKKRQGLNINLHTTKWEQEEHAVNVKRNGKEYKIFVNGNPVAAQAINGFTNPDAKDGEMKKAAMWVKNFMARAFTSMNPAFIFTNLARDLVWAGTSVAIKENASYTRLYSENISKAMTTAQLPRLVSKWKKGTLDMSNPIEKYFHEFVTNGGETGFTQLNTVDDYKRNMERFIKEAQGGVTAKAKKGWRWIWDNVEFLNRSAEDTTRFMVYLTSRQMGRPITESIANAKDITVNFNKKGRGGFGATYMNFAYIFFNATIQSLANFGKLIANHPKKTATALTVFGASGMIAPMTALALQAMLSGDDDEPTYWDLPEWVRRNNIVIYVGGSGYVTIPLPHELRPFYGMGELAFSTLMGKEKPDTALAKAAAGFASLMPFDYTGNAGNAAVNFTPTIAQPIAQLIVNKDYFGTPIYRKTAFNEQDPEWTKAYKSTNQLLVGATEFLNELTGGDEVKNGLIDLNPAIIEHLYEGYLGGMGKTINRAAKTLSMLWDEDARTWRNVPVVSSFYQVSDERTSGSQVNREYYDVLDEAERTEYLYRGYNKRAKMGSIEYAEKLNKLINSDVFKRYQKVNSYKKAITKLNEALKQADPTDREQIETRIMEMKVDMLEELEKLELNNK